MTYKVKMLRGNMPDYKKIEHLYKQTFPRKERIPNIVLKIMMAFKIVEVLTFYKEGKFCGFSFLIIQKQIILIMYLAVEDSMRNQGIGSVMLKYIKNKYSDRTIILDVEKPNDEADNAVERRRRIEFYIRNGFYETNQYYTMRGVTYEIMSTDARFREKDYKTFWREMFKRKS